MDLSILNKQNEFRLQVIDTLAHGPLDYPEVMQFINPQRNRPMPWEGVAGVLLPLYFQEGPEKNPTGKYVFLLNKRSSKVKQAGDLCAPGGGIHPFLDSISQKLLKTGLFPCFRGPAFERAKGRGKSLYESILFFLANALRESWEELRLSPFNVEFLGPLQVYGLGARNRIIVPLVGRVKHDWKPRLSWEVEEIVPIPLEAFFIAENYALYSLEVPETLVAQGIPNPWEFPCLAYGQDGKEEILWGATFKIIQTFFQIVLGLPLPYAGNQRVIRRPLVPTYFSSSENL
jgi:8-oxo-dGTP pyrophosphatase MutT (NUDIX family)